MKQNKMHMAFGPGEDTVEIQGMKVCDQHESNRWRPNGDCRGHR